MTAGDLTPFRRHPSHQRHGDTSDDGHPCAGWPRTMSHSVALATRGSTDVVARAADSRVRGSFHPPYLLVAHNCVLKRRLAIRMSLRLGGAAAVDEHRSCRH